MTEFCESLESAGHGYYCSFLDKEMRKDIGKQERIENAFKKIDELDGVIALAKSDDKSEGMLLEYGYAAAKGKKIILFIKMGGEVEYRKQFISDRAREAEVDI